MNPIIMLLFVPFLFADSDGSPPSEDTRSPNVIIIMADDLGRSELGCTGSERIRTPHIDRLRDRGMLFTQAYSGSTVCAPSRCTLLTGKHTGHAQVRDNFEERNFTGAPGEEGVERQTVPERLSRRAAAATPTLDALARLAAHDDEVLLRALLLFRANSAEPRRAAFLLLSALCGADAPRPRGAPAPAAAGDAALAERSDTAANDAELDGVLSPALREAVATLAVGPEEEEAVGGSQHSNLRGGLPPEDPPFCTLFPNKHNTHTHTLSHWDGHSGGSRSGV